MAADFLYIFFPNNAHFWIYCTSKCPEQCFYGSQVDLTPPLPSRGPQRSHRSHGEVHEFLSDFAHFLICYTSQCPGQCFFGTQVYLSPPLPSKVAQIFAIDFLR